MNLANRKMSDVEVDAVTTIRFQATPYRLSMRREWGRRAGRKAWTAGVEHSDNAFRRLPRMPMHDGWLEGWEGAHLRQVKEKANGQ